MVTGWVYAWAVEMACWTVAKKVELTAVGWVFEKGRKMACLKVAKKVEMMVTG